VQMGDPLGQGLFLGSVASHNHISC
jgi:hypothetical protein